jgi:hypothetical protein
VHAQRLGHQLLSTPAVVTQTSDTQASGWNSHLRHQQNAAVHAQRLGRQLLSTPAVVTQTSDTQASG